MKRQNYKHEICTWMHAFNLKQGTETRTLFTYQQYRHTHSLTHIYEVRVQKILSGNVTKIFIIVSFAVHTLLPSVVALGYHWKKKTPYELFSPLRHIQLIFTHMHTDIYIYIYIYIHIITVLVVTFSLHGFAADQMQYNLESAQYLWQSYHIISKCTLVLIYI